MNYPYINIHTHTEGHETGVVKVKSYLMGREIPISDAPYSVGVHPWDANIADENLLDKFPLGDKNFVAIGECGLDFSVKDLDKAKQFWWFDQQLKLAEKMCKPVVIHCVKAYNELLMEVKKFHVETMIVHGFIGSKQLAKQLVDAGFYLSFGAASLLSNRTMEALKTVPIDRIFLETDDCDDDIKDIYAKVATILDISDIEILKKEIYTTYKKCKIG